MKQRGICNDIFTYLLENRWQSNAPSFKFETSCYQKMADMSASMEASQSSESDESLPSRPSVSRKDGERGRRRSRHSDLWKFNVAKHRRSQVRLPMWSVLIFVTQCILGVRRECNGVQFHPIEKF